MKICLLNTLFPPNIVGGAEISVSILAKSLVKAGHEVVVITLHPDQEAQCSEWNGVKVYYLPLDNLYWPFVTASKPSLFKRLRWHLRDIWNRKAARRVAHILDAERPDILHSNIIVGFSVAIWREARKRNIKIIHTLREYGLLCPRETLFHNGRNCERRCAGCVVFSEPNRWATRLVSSVTALSNYTLKAHTERSFFPAASQHVIVNSIDTKDASAQPAKRNQTEIVFGYLGRLEPEKGIEILLAATERLPAQGWRLYIAGSGRNEYVAALRASHPSPAIHWLGFVKPEELFHKIDVLVVPSIWAEPFGRILIEAAAYNIPVIASDAGGIPEVMEHGISGVIVPAKDPEKLADIMADMISRQNVSAITTSNPAWHRQFSEETMVGRYIDCYNDLCWPNRANTGYAKAFRKFG